MKLFNVIAAAAVIGTSFITANPVEARNGWVYLGETKGQSWYIKPAGCSGSVCRILNNVSGEDQYYSTFNCSTWQRKRHTKDGGWKDIMPGSYAESSAKIACR